MTKKKEIKKKRINKPKKEEESKWDTVLFFVFIFLLIFIGYALRWATSYNSASATFSVQAMTDGGKLSDYEMKQLFPTYKEDWNFVQKMVGVSGLRLPDFYWLTDQAAEFLNVNGQYNEEINVIRIDRKLFASSTNLAYMRYVVMHEMTHAALTRSAVNDEEKDQHCFMLYKNYYMKIGEYIGDQGVGERATEKYRYFCSTGSYAPSAIPI